MYILGYSGLNDALTFRKQTLPGLIGQEYRISQGFDSAAALFKDGVLVAAAEEERFIGIKHSEKFPLNAIQFCLNKANIRITDLSYICHSFNYSEYESLFKKDDYNYGLYQTVLAPSVQIKLFQSHWPELQIEKLFVPVKHHAAHAASAFYPSGYSEALVLVADGMGEMDSISLFVGKENQLKRLKHYDLLSSLGILYSMVTLHLGFSINSGESKVMGLAPYGDSNRFQSFFSECITLGPEGEIFIEGFLKNISFMDRETYRGFRQWLAEKTIPARRPEDPLEQQHKDLAASLQQALNTSLLHLLIYWQNYTSLKKLCYAGGVALNCTTNGVLYRSGLFNDIYVQPAAGDAGTALGGPLYQFRHILKHIEKDKPQRLPLFGPKPKISQSLLDSYTDIFFNQKIAYKKLSPDFLLDQTAALLAQGKIVAWVQGEMEFGPRALGHRSLLADPRIPTIRDKINQIVKKRESFRPFAPSVKREKAHIYFEVEESSTFSCMLFVMPVRPNYYTQLPAITHKDGTARVQTVDRDEHPFYWKLLDKFEEKTGLPMLLNTSYNVRGQPIICTEKEAIDAFLTIDIDALVIENLLFYKEQNL